MTKVWLIGAGGMAQDYIKVMKDLDCKFTVIGRGKESAEKCEEQTRCKVEIGGLDTFLDQNPSIPTHVIVAVGVESLFCITKKIIKIGVKNILVEKPGALNNEEFQELLEISEANECNVFIAYNRRFYSSVIKAKEIIKEDGGVTSFNFEFTEWSHKIGPLKKAEGVKEKWFLGNSTHVVDLAFFLGGKPRDISTYTSGSLPWHSTSSIFSGAGVSENQALFNYHANWESAGRWSVEILTKNNKLIFCPLERLQIQKRGSIDKINVDIDYSLDEKYKPGLYLEAMNFIYGNKSDLCTLKDQYQNFKIYNKIANY